MSCQLCTGNIFKEKLGRCKQCMLINASLLIVAVALYLWVDVTQLLAVQEIALMMFLGASAMLMSAHVIAWCFYRLKGEN